MSTGTLLQILLQVFCFLYPYSIGTEIAYEITLTEWLKVLNSRYHCSEDSNAFSTLA